MSLQQKMKTPQRIRFGDSSTVTLVQKTLLFLQNIKITVSKVTQFDYSYTQQGVIQKVRSVKTSSFWTHPPPPLPLLFVLVRFTCIPLQRTLALVSYTPPPLSKKFPDTYDAYFEKKIGVGGGGDVKREKNYFFLNST